MRRLFNRGRLWLLTASAGGSLFVLEACDPTVRDTVLSGVGSAATGLAGTFIQAFIESLQAEDEETISTVKAITEFVPEIFA